MDGAMINPCIKGPDGRIAGCVTHAVMEAFKSEYATLANAYGVDADWAEEFDELAEGMRLSEERFDASFLNTLKSVVDRCRADLPDIAFTREASRVYHSLVGLACSQGVYDDVMSESIRVFTEHGLAYIGNGMPDLGYDVYTFTRGEVTVGIEMIDKDKLYGLWTAGGTRRAVVLVGGILVTMTYTGDIYGLCDAINACVEDFLAEDALAESLPKEERLALLVDAAKALIEEFRNEGVGGDDYDFGDLVSELEAYSSGDFI